MIATIVGTCSLVKYTPRPSQFKNESGFEHSCTPIEDIDLCPNFVDVSGRCCKGIVASKNIYLKCDPKSEGPAIITYLPVLYHTTCSLE